MYTSRPSRQQQRKGLQLMKSMILQQRKIKQSNIYNHTISSQTSIRQHMNQQVNRSKQKINSRTNNINENTQNNGNLNIKLSSKNNPQNNKTNSDRKNTKHTIQNLTYNNNINLSQIKLTHSKIVYLNNQIKSNINTNISNSIRKPLTKSNLLTSSLQKIYNQQQIKSSYLLSSLNKGSLTNLSTDKQRLTKTLPQSRNQLQKSYLSLTNTRSYQFLQKNILVLNNDKYLQIPKLPLHYKQAKQRTTIQNVKRMYKQLQIKKQQIKIVRRQFMEVLQYNKKKYLSNDKQSEQIQKRMYEISNRFDKDKRQKQIREQVINKLLRQIQYKQEKSQKQQIQYQQRRQQLQGSLINIRQQNSGISRRIYHLKQDIHKLYGQRIKYNTKQQRNRQNLRQIINKQQIVNELRIRKQLKIIQKRRQLRQGIIDEIDKQDKQQIYDRLDKQLNLIKQYYKISQNSKQFKRNINKLTKFSSYPKDIQKFINLNNNYNINMKNNILNNIKNDNNINIRENNNNINMRNDNNIDFKNDNNINKLKITNKSDSSNTTFNPIHNNKNNKNNMINNNNKYNICLYQQDIMMLYKRQLWNTQMPKFLQAQPLIIQSPKIRQLKNIQKQLQIKKHVLSQTVKQKQKFVQSLTYRHDKLIQQIQQLQQNKRLSQLHHNKSKLTHSRIIDWGF